MPVFRKYLIPLQSLIDKDIDMATAVDMAHKEFVSQSSQMFSKLELKLLEFHVANLEYACGADLCKVSVTGFSHSLYFKFFESKSRLVYPLNSIMTDLIGVIFS